MSHRLPSLTPKQVLRILERAGFYRHHATGSHYILKHRQKTSARVTLPWHARELKRGTLAGIIEQAGLTTDEFRALL